MHTHTHTHTRTHAHTTHLGGQELERAVAQRQAQVLRRHPLDERRRAQAHDVADLLAPQRIKHDELVDAVDKLGPARARAWS
jgi:hypothetical protein